MGPAISKALHRNHTASAPDPIDAATATAIIAAVNEQQLAQLLPPLIAALDDKTVTEENASSGGPVFVLDLDCGTGHNTLTLAHLAHDWRVPVELEGWDSHQENVQIAENRCKDVRWENTNSSVTFSRANHWRRLEIGHPGLKYFGHMYEFVLSSLVVNSMPLEVFFKGIEGLLSRDSVALVTCVHPDLGGAGSGLDVNENEKCETIEKSRFRHTVQKVVKVATECGLTLQGAVNEVKLSSMVVEGLEERLRGNARKWVGRKVLVSVVLRRVTDARF
jgi:SAM-dependent methyltransferase